MTGPGGMPIDRRLFVGGGIASLALAAAGCSTERTTSGAAGSGGAAGGATNDGVVTVNFVGPTANYYPNWNPFSPAEHTGSGIGYFYEPLVRVNRNSGFAAEPWLAEKWEIDDAHTELLFHLRQDVTWSDGEAFDADDVVFTLNVPLKHAESNLVLSDRGIAKVSKVDSHTVKVVMKEPKLGHEINVGAATIYPEHVFSKQNLEKWTNESPVTTGPWKLADFSPQQVKLTHREDYWGGTFPHVKECRWAVFGNADAGKALVKQGKIDMATMSWPNADTTFESIGPDYFYDVYPAGGGEALLFNCARGPFADAAVRRAVSSAIDFAKVMSLYEIGLDLANVTGMAESVWGDQIAPEFKGKIVSQDVAGAKKELADAGWSVKDGKLVKGGESYHVALKTVAEYTNWATWSDGIKEQLMTGLGLDIAVLKVPEDQLAEQITKGDFDVVMDWVGGSSLLSDFYATGNAGMRKSDIVPIGQAAAANAIRFSNDEVSEALDKMAVSLDEDDITELCQQVQRIVVKERPFVAYDTSGNFLEVSGKKWKGVPKAADGPNYVPVPYGNPDTTLLFKALLPSGN